MISIVSHISQRIEKGFRELKFLRNGRSDTATSYLGTPHGEDFVPIKSAKMVQIRSTNSQESVIVCIVNKADDSLNEGDKVVYATDADGVVKSRIYLRNDGRIEVIADDKVEVKGTSVVFLDGEDNAVRYSELATAFNELNDKYNDLASKWNTFAAAYVPGGPGTQGLPPTAQTGSASTADIAPSKIDEINVP